MMIKHYLKVAFRNLAKYKVQSIVSILGLSIFTSLLFPEDKKEKKHKIEINEDSVE